MEVAAKPAAQELGLSSVREQRIGGPSAELASGKLFMVLLESESNLDGNHVLAITHLLTCCICFLWCWPSYLAAVFRKWLQTFSTSCFYSKTEIWFGCFVSLLKKLLQLEYHYDCKIMGDIDVFSFKENYFIPISCLQMHTLSSVLPPMSEVDYRNSTPNQE